MSGWRARCGGSRKQVVSRTCKDYFVFSVAARREYTTLCTAVSRAELESMANLRKFAPGNGFMGNEWAAESAADAKLLDEINRRGRIDALNGIVLK